MLKSNEDWIPIFKNFGVFIDRNQLFSGGPGTELNNKGTAFCKMEVNSGFPHNLFLPLFVSIAEELISYQSKEAKPGMFLAE